MAFTREFAREQDSFRIQLFSAQDDLVLPTSQLTVLTKSSETTLRGLANLRAKLQLLERDDITPTKVVLATCQDTGVPPTSTPEPCTMACIITTQSAINGLTEDAQQEQVERIAFERFVVQQEVEGAAADAAGEIAAEHFELARKRRVIVIEATIEVPTPRSELSQGPNTTDEIPRRTVPLSPT